MEDDKIFLALGSYLALGFLKVFCTVPYFGETPEKAIGFVCKDDRISHFYLAAIALSLKSAFKNDAHNSALQDYVKEHHWKPSQMGVVHGLNYIGSYVRFPQRAHISACRKEFAQAFTKRTLDLEALDQPEFKDIAFTKTGPATLTKDNRVFTREGRQTFGPVLFAPQRIPA